MLKNEFLDKLRENLFGLPQKELEERIDFYSEMIDDKIEDGLAEEEAVSETGSVEEISSQIIKDIPLSKIARERMKPKRRMRAWETVLLALGSPIWLSLGVAALAVTLSIYVVLWSVAVSVWAIFVSFAACFPVGIAAGIIFIATGSVFSGIAAIGAGIICAGVAILLFFGCISATKAIILLTKGVAFGIKRLFIKKEVA